ncbi:MAG: TIGR00730 family Rossman fold protein [Verrucomicrobiota bacterium]
MRRICVYCGSSAGFDPTYRSAAEELGAFLAAKGIGLVYGGGNVGLMGALADATLDAGGEVIGIIPHHLIAMEVGHRKLTSLIAVDTMHARKLQMADLADAFIALPGGIGTAEELLEVFTWLQLGIHAKPVGLLNTNNYFEHLLNFLGHMENSGFLKRAHREMLMVDRSPESLLDQLRGFVPERVDKRIPPTVGPAEE